MRALGVVAPAARVAAARAARVAAATLVAPGGVGHALRRVRCDAERGERVHDAVPVVEHHGGQDRRHHLRPTGRVVGDEPHEHLLHHDEPGVQHDGGHLGGAGGLGHLTASGFDLAGRHHPLEDDGRREDAHVLERVAVGVDVRLDLRDALEELLDVSERRSDLDLEALHEVEHGVTGSRDDPRPHLAADGGHEQITCGVEMMTPRLTDAEEATGAGDVHLVDAGHDRDRRGPQAGADIRLLDVDVGDDLEGGVHPLGHRRLGLAALGVLVVVTAVGVVVVTGVGHIELDQPGRNRREVRDAPDVRELHGVGVDVPARVVLQVLGNGVGLEAVEVLGADEAPDLDHLLLRQLGPGDRVGVGADVGQTLLAVDAEGVAGDDGRAELAQAAGGLPLDVVEGPDDPDERHDRRHHEAQDEPALAHVLGVEVAHRGQTEVEHRAADTADPTAQEERDRPDPPIRVQGVEQGDAADDGEGEGPGEVVGDDGGQVDEDTVDEQEVGHGGEADGPVVIVFVVLLGEGRREGECRSRAQRQSHPAEADDAVEPEAHEDDSDDGADDEEVGGGAGETVEQIEHDELLSLSGKVSERRTGKLTTRDARCAGVLASCYGI